MDKEIFAQRIYECEQMLYRISMSMLKDENDCEDAVQQTVLTALEKLHTLKNDDFFRTWIVRILINRCNDILRYKKRCQPVDKIFEPSDEGAYKSIELRQLIEGLPLKIRQVIVLHYIEKYSVKEIKSILKIPEGTVKSRLSKGRELLKLELDA